MPMSPGDLRALLAAQKADAMSAIAASKLSSERTNALDYYMGDMSKDMPAPAGRSSAVSTDVSDTVEGMLPSLIEIFTGDEVVQFQPVGPEDEAAAEQETDYINHVFLQQNQGFLVLYSFIKDALLSKTGIVKVYWDEREIEERETYYDLDEASFAALVQNPDIEIVEHTERAPPAHELFPGDYKPGEDYDPEDKPPSTHDVTVAITRKHAQAKVDPVPPEEFGISRNARSLEKCDYCFHDVARSEADLIAEGFDAKGIKSLPSYVASQTIEEQARDTVDESTLRQGGGDASEHSSRLIRVTEHYIRMDYEEDGKPALYRITTGGEEGEILTRDGEPCIVREDMIPFAAMTPVIVTHRFFGRSIADLVMDIQRIKTAILRSLLDNAYLANNPRVEIAEAYATESTLDDLLVSRPGGIVRTKQPGGLQILQHPDIGANVYPLLQYQDATREWRTGVSRQGQGVDPNALQNQVATIANQMQTASQAKLKLIARIFAETGIRDLFQLLHATIRKHGTKAEIVRLRNQWVQVDPRDWKTRNDMTINVGLGTGTKAEQLAHVMTIMGLQQQAMAAGMTNLVGAPQLYNSAKQVVKLVGLPNPDEYFTDPAQQPAPQTPPDPKMMEIQAKAQVEQQKVQADITHQQVKTQADIALAERKAQLEEKKMMLDMQIREREHQMQMASHIAKAASQPAPTGADGLPAPADNSAHIAPVVSMMMEALHKLSAPKRARKLADGSWVSEPAQ
jgi:hypothetical protein